MYKILITDDEEKIRALIKKYAIFEGHTAVEAANGMEAVELCRKEAFDIIIMDIMMPELDGKEASRKIRSMADQREDAAEIPILAMTAQASTESIHQCKSAGMNECIFKPVNAKELIRLLQDIVAKI